MALAGVQLGLVAYTAVQSGTAARAAAGEPDRGQATVEFLGMLPLILLVLVLCWQFVLVGYTFVLAGNAADKGARAAGGGPARGSTQGVRRVYAGVRGSGEEHGPRAAGARRRGQLPARRPPRGADVFARRAAFGFRSHRVETARPRAVSNFRARAGRLIPRPPRGRRRCR
ncbi:TadE/TadG family type IV pilus assembly protein [Streptomyces tardus]|uniref:TadE/TadG family type IV pilus assembly protein n=1 Tax=Streptomyces tardus TaxID=2780544 RepID=UPI0035569BE6